MEQFLIVFSGRNSVMTLSKYLKLYRIKHEIISTPRQVGLSCSLSVVVYKKDMPNVLRIIKHGKFANYPTIYQIKNNGIIRTYIRTM